MVDLFLMDTIWGEIEERQFVPVDVYGLIDVYMGLHILLDEGLELYNHSFGLTWMSYRDWW